MLSRPISLLAGAALGAGLLTVPAAGAFASEPSDACARVSFFPTPLPADEVAAVEQAAEAAIADGAVGITVGVTRPGRGCLVRSWGTADVSTGEPLTPAHHTRIGSISKSFTARAVLDLVEDGRLSLEDTVDQFVEGVPNGDRITVRHLLAMQSGLPELQSFEPVRQALQNDADAAEWEPADAIRLLREHDPEFEPGERTSYSNTNYIIAGLILEEVTGNSAAEVIDNRVLRPWWLRETDLPDDDSLPDPAVHGYVFDSSGDAPTDVTNRNAQVAWTAGGMTSTAPDLLRWAEALAEGSRLDWRLAIAQQLFSPVEGRDFEYGLGLMRKGEWVGHLGEFKGYHAIAVHHRDSDTSVVVLINNPKEVVDGRRVLGEIISELVPGSMSGP